MRHVKKQERMTYTLGKKQVTETENDQMLGLIDKDLKVDIILIFRELKEAMI